MCAHQAGGDGQGPTATHCTQGSGAAAGDAGEGDAKKEVTAVCKPNHSAITPLSIGNSFSLP